MVKSLQETELAVVDCIVCLEERDENADASLSTLNASVGAKTVKVEEAWMSAYQALEIGGNCDVGGVADGAAEAGVQKEQAEEASRPPLAPVPDPVPVPPDVTHTAALNQLQPAEAHLH